MFMRLERKCVFYSAHEMKNAIVKKRVLEC